MKVKHLLNKEDFNNVLAERKKLRGDRIELYTHEDNTTEDIYVGIIIAKKTEPTAVKRNLLRRIVYGYYRDFKEKIKPGTKTVVRFYKKSSEASRKELSRATREEISTLLKKAGTQR